MLILIDLVLDFLLIIGFIWLLAKFDRSSKIRWNEISQLGVVILLGVIVAYVIEELVLSNPNTVLGFNMPTALGFICVGIIEESCKSIPVIIFLWKKHYFRDYTTGIMYFAIAGQIFSTVEDLLYLTRISPISELGRLSLDPFFHATTCAIFGFAVVRYKITGKSIWKVCFWFTFAVLFHALNDFSELSIAISQAYFLIPVAACTSLGSWGVIVFLFRRARKHDVRLGYAWTKPKKFCPHCGVPNVSHTLFCTHCGTKYA